jgi:hypothetical protein
LAILLLRGFERRWTDRMTRSDCGTWQRVRALLGTSTPEFNRVAANRLAGRGHGRGISLTTRGYDCLCTPKEIPMPGPYGTIIPAQPPSGPYGTIIPAQPPNGGGLADSQNDPVLSLLAPPPLVLNNNAYANNPNSNVYSRSPNGDAYSMTPNLPSPPPVQQGPRPTAFDQQPDKKNASAMGQARILGAKNGRYNGEDNRNVKYINDLKTKREKYQIEIGATMLRRKLVFDTKEIKKHFEQKKKDSTGAANLGMDKKGTAFPTPTEWADEALIWVCAPDPETDKPVIYSHVCKRDRFHHSSMVDGGDVIGAGEWIVRKGKLWKISANSGHYQPTIDFLYRAVLQMSAAFQGDTTVFLYDTKDDKWVDYPIRLFISAPTAGNRYCTHPRARNT